MALSCGTVTSPGLGLGLSLAAPVPDGDMNGTDARAQQYPRQCLGSAWQWWFWFLGQMKGGAEAPPVGTSEQLLFGHFGVGLRRVEEEGTGPGVKATTGIDGLACRF